MLAYKKEISLAISFKASFLEKRYWPSSKKSVVTARKSSVKVRLRVSEGRKSDMLEKLLSEVVDILGGK